MIQALVDQAIELNKINRQLNEKNFKMISDFFVFKEFCTIHINVGRASGNTEYIVNNANSSDLVVCHSYNQKNMIIKKMAENQNFSIPEFLLPPRFSSKIMDKGYNKIYVDNPRLCFKNLKSPDEFYYIFLGTSKDKTFIFLGE